ncbi:GIY-YIG nuclease family protein [Microbacteriaceae bacterium]|nr:GIY-YIG nuclease family protein [Candidatus Saccharibacteria bacterium]
MNKTSNWWLYVLKLEDSKWYVGITSKTPEIRMSEHINGIRAAYWTAKHRPVEIVHREDLGSIEKSKAEKRENKMTRALMKQRGINNVRGGDLRSTEKYIQRFGYIWPEELYITITVVIALMLVIVYLLIDKYFF